MTFMIYEYDPKYTSHTIFPWYETSIYLGSWTLRLILLSKNEWYEARVNSIAVIRTGRRLKRHI